ncbi:MAG: LytTR family DNA-binding domain-containing protein [Pedobacter sp.]
MQTYNCLIVDDEPPAREILKRYVEKTPMLHLAGEFINGFEVITFLHNQNVDLIFLDIQMPQLNGLELLRSLANPPKVIFTTAFEHHAFESYELDAVDYLLKPIKFERFIKAINKAIPSKEAEQPDRVPNEKSAGWAENFLYFRSERKMVKVILHDILYIESLKDYVKIVTDKEQVITKYSMTAIEAMLPAKQFLRTHRSYLVALDKINSFSTTYIEVLNIEIPVGRLYQREVIKILSQ